LCGCNGFHNSSNESEDGDSIEVVSNVDGENQIVDMTKYLRFSSDDNSEINDSDNHCSILDDTYQVEYNSP
jgi:hypothetical protein